MQTRCGSRSYMQCSSSSSSSNWCQQYILLQRHIRCRSQMVSAHVTGPQCRLGCAVAWLQRLQLQPGRTLCHVLRGIQLWSFVGHHRSYLC